MIRRRFYNTGTVGENFKSKEEAERAIGEIWPGYVWQD
jgi:hypothetical protein